jgi:hypothetical protein
VKELQVPTHLVEVEIFTTEGVLRQGAVFVGESPYRQGGPEDVADVLNDERSFLPFCSSDATLGQPLLNKDHILHVHLCRASQDYAYEDVHTQSSDVETCTLVLGDGSRLTGQLVVPTPAETSRLVDKVNLAPRFMPFVSDDGIHFVHRCHIARVY